MSKTYERRLSAGKIYGVTRDDGTVKILADCQFESTARIEFTLPGEAASRYFEDPARPCIQDLFPDLRKEHREILVSGTSPAWWDRMAGKRMPKTPEAFLARYGKLGYILEP